jgi:hypothetical protein
MHALLHIVLMCSVYSMCCLCVTVQDKLKLTVKLTPCSNIQSRCGYLEVRAVVVVAAAVVCIQCISQIALVLLLVFVSTVFSVPLGSTC